MTCNIEGAKSNTAFLVSLSSNNRIICLQEHFLWEFQKNFLFEIFPNHDNHTRCHDSNEPLDGSKLPRGQSGVSILWPKSWNSNVKKLTAGNERIIAITLSSNYNLCIINAYLPTQDKDSVYEYSNCLDIIYDIVHKYQETHEIILCGDLNGTLLKTRSNKHDRLLRELVQELSLFTAGDYSDQMTFYHHSGLSSSQIDYILLKNQNIFEYHKIWNKTAINISAHVPVEITSKVKPPESLSKTDYEEQCSFKLLWNEIDAEQYNSVLANGLLKFSDNLTTTEQTEIITVELKRAAKTAVPSKPIKLKGPKWKATPTVRKHLKTCKTLYSKWKDAGRPSHHQTRTELHRAKKLLRSTQRIEKAMDRKNLYQKIMENPSTELFYRLINRNRRTRNNTSNCLEIDGEIDFSTDNQRKAFRAYYEDLSLPKDDEYDSSYMDLCKTRQNLVEQYYKDHPVQASESYTELEVKTSIERLNTGKSADEFGLTAEHLKHAKSAITPVLTRLFNKIKNNHSIPKTFKAGILTPVIKSGKNPMEVKSYRGITVTSVIGKVHELCILEKLKLQSDSELQFGFTEGLCPLMASVIITETKCEKLQKNTSTFIATVDVQSAFDVVKHTILFDKLLDEKVHPDLWRLIKELYTGLESKVKWIGGLSNSFSIGQGVRQGGILSTHLYKLYVKNLLLELENNSLGSHLGNIFVGSPTCADDVALLSSDPDELQLMFDVIARYANQHQYNIHPSKTKVLGSNTTNNSQLKWSLKENILELSDSTTHLGIERTNRLENEKNIDNRIKLARRTKYSLMGSGLHGTNGIDPITGYNIYKTYVLPRLLYGLEALPMTTTQINTLEKFHRDTLRHIQSLPQRTAKIAIYLLIGALPIEGEIHRRQLSLLYLLLSAKNSKIKELIQRQPSVNFDNHKSFFYCVMKTLQQYQLPNISELQNQLPTKLAWKKMVKLKITTYWNQTFITEAETKTSLKYLALNHLQASTPHNIYRTLQPTVLDVRKGHVKARMTTRTYILQADRHKFSRYEIEPTCPLCGQEPEDLPHMLTTCMALSDVRKETFPPIKYEIIGKVGLEKWKTTFNDRNRITMLILDCTNFIELFNESKDLEDIETLTRNMCYRMHTSRLRLMNG